MWKAYPIFVMLFSVRYRSSGFVEHNLPCPVKVDDRIVLVGLHDKNHFYVKSEHVDGKTDISCKIPVSVEEGRMIYPDMHASVLGNGKIVVGAIKTDSNSRSNPSNFFVIVDPLECTADTFEIAGEMAKPRYRWDPIVYQDTFDLFPNMITEVFDVPSVRRYNDKGEQVKLNYSLDSDIERRNSGVFFAAVNENKDTSKGYLLALNGKVDLTLSLLGPDLQILKQIKRSNASTCAISAAFNNFIICYEFKENKKVYCEKLDKKLNSKFKVQMTESVSLGKQFWAQSLPDGGAMVVQDNTYVKSDLSGLLRAVRVHRITKNGATGKPVVITKDVKDNLYSSGYLMDNGDFCVSIVEEKGIASDEVSNGLYSRSKVTAYCTKLRS